MNSNFVNRILRLLAILGFFITLIVKSNAFLDWNKPLLILFISHIVVFLGITFLFFNQTKLILRHLDLLVPLGIYLLLSEFVGFIGFPVSMDFAFLDPETKELVFTDITYYKILFWLYLSISGIIYTGWVMALIINIIENGKADLFYDLKAAFQNILRVGIVFTVGWWFVFICTMYAPTLSENINISTVILFFILLVWNFFTAPGSLLRFQI